MTTTPTPIHDAVREHYAERIKSSTSCCSPNPSASGDSPLYPADLLTTLPEGESAVSYGCGDPVTLASLKPGQTVLDLGSGAGLDCFFAAKQVGETGRVIGVDMTPEMIQRATASARRLNIANVEFRQGLIEDLPVESNSVDVTISNCVINLSPDKARVFREAFRVLKPAGRLAISDIVALAPIPENLRRDVELYTACAAGAALVDDVKVMLREAGFEEIRVEPKPQSRELIREFFPSRGLENYFASASIEAVKPKAA